jgi:hypothetical protein
MGFHRELVMAMVTTATKSELRIFYRPVLDPVKDVVRMYRAEPVLTRAGERVVGAKRIIEYDDDSMATARRNAAVLKAAGADLAVAHESEREVFLMMPINANAMATKESSTFMVGCLEALPPVCAKAAVLHIFDLPGRGGPAATCSMTSSCRCASPSTGSWSSRRSRYSTTPTLPKSTPMAWSSTMTSPTMTTPA